MKEKAHRGLRHFSKIVCFSVFVLIFFGALVKSNDAGLAVPDWPNSFGYNMFTFPPSLWVGIIYYEHVHRLIASLVGLLTLIFVLWVHFSEARKSVRTLAWLGLLAVILQGVLGGITVLYLLPTSVSVSHGVLAQSFLMLTILLAFAYSKEWRGREKTEAASNALWKSSLILTLLVFLQLILGALVRHTNSALAIPDFPLMGGVLIPAFGTEMLATINAMRESLNLMPVDMLQVLLHFFHRLGAVFVFLLTLLVLRLGLKSSRDHIRIRKSCREIALLVLIQITLGALVVLSGEEAITASFHVFIGAVLLALCTLLNARIYATRS